MDNLPLLIYLTAVIPNLQNVGFFIIALGVVAGIGLPYKKDIEFSSYEYIPFTGWFRKLTVTLLTIGLLLVALVPDRNTLYTMIGVNAGIQAIQSEYGQQLSGEMGETFTKSLQLLNQKIDEQLELEGD